MESIMEKPTMDAAAGAGAGGGGGGGIGRTKSEQLAPLQSLSRTPSAETVLSMPADATSLSRKPSFGRKRRSASVGGGNNRTHIRKSRSAQLKLDVEDLVSSGAALSRASSASLGFSFTFTGFTSPLQHMCSPDPPPPFSDDDDSPMDIEAGTRRKKLMTEPTLPIYLKFAEVKYRVAGKGSPREILGGISGSASPGEVLALMGPSGSGKTTLLSILGGRAGSGAVEGSISYNDEPYSKSLKRRIGFVTQDDVLFTHLTVKETLTYAALLRLPRTMTQQQKKERAMDIIYELGLERCQDTMIGGSFIRGVSGGERKRVCIGNEILINPSLLFLDEPTSGLDSTTALRIVQLLHDIAEDGKTVITTIHQPSSRLFHKFDKLILLGKGSLLYFGKASEAMPYFQSIGCTPLIAMNPAEFLLDLANGNTNDVSVPSELDDKYLVDAYETRVAFKEKKKLLAPLPICDDLKATITSSKREWGTSWWQQYSILFCRGIKERRHDYLSWMRITQVIATSIILGLLWWRSDPSTLKGLEDQAGLLFFIAVFWGFFPVFTAIFTFPQERAMLNKERAVDMYKLSAYFLARTTSDLPLDLFLPVIFMVIVYFMAGLKATATHFFLSVLTVFLSIIAAQGLGLVIGATLLDIKKATTLASVTVMTFMLAGGFFVKRVPPFISWLRYLSFNYHTYRLLLKVQYDPVPDILTTTKHMDNGATEVAALVAMIIGYRVLAYLSLRRVKGGSS
ncbi:ABC transporter G family member 22 isoform X2 [Sorghum bicolor]|uniref:ABC transporter G family member 22 isoform X2 n=1 Tax=Sorghum bicolor TaxID=4558 RepID=UPI000B42659D|nr:ABC transporter G family member 22 isoform X2 [Sorghum bicolor]|eukprot:XP_021320431.1 ABC transporter G family member 22 isoform X2 [Sorghum bicolor]